MVLDKLVPDNVFVTVVAQKFADVANTVEPWYGTKYQTEPIPAEKIAKWTKPPLNDKLLVVLLAWTQGDQMC
jgi:secreted Zn-dependent insulinase-like peptidase